MTKNNFKIIVFLLTVTITLFMFYMEFIHIVDSELRAGGVTDSLFSFFFYSSSILFIISLLSTYITSNNLYIRLIQNISNHIIDKLYNKFN